MTNSAELYSSLTQDRVGDLLAGLGNHEGKAMLVLAMQPDEVYAYGGLHKLITSRSSTGNENIDRSSPMAWCKQSLEPIGMVTRVMYGDPLQFGLSETGALEGKSLAGLSLPISERHGKSLTEVWGPTASPGSIRSPLARFLIVSALLDTEHPLTPGIISSETGQGPTQTGIQLAAMRRDGVAMYNEWSHSSQDVIYRLPTEEYVINPGTKKRTINALEYLQEHRTATLTDLDDFCWSRLNSIEQSKSDRAQFRFNLSVSLNGLVDNQTLEREEGRERKDSVFLTDSQRQLWMELFIDLRKFIEQDKTAMATFRSQGNKFIGNPSLVSNALASARRSQTGSHDASLESTVLGITASCGSPVSIREIADHISQQHDRRVSIGGVRGVLKNLIKDGRVTESDYRGKVKLYEMASEQ